MGRRTIVRMASFTTGRTAIAALIGALACLAPAAARAERVSHFDATLELGVDGTLNVTERIAYDFGLTWRRGIRRHIVTLGPTGRYAVDVVGVTDTNGRPFAYEVVRTREAVTVAVGDPKNLTTGPATYVLRYAVSGAVSDAGDALALRWPVTGSEWQVPIERVTASVSIPEVASNAVERRCGFGHAGASPEPCSWEVEGGRTVFTAAGLVPGEGVQLDVRFPRGVVSIDRPAGSVLGSWLARLEAWYAVPLAVFLVLLFRAWQGRSFSRHEAHRTLALPAGVCPAEAGLVWDGEVDMDDLVATVLHLAARGHISVGELAGTERVFGSRQDFVLIRDRECRDPLSPFESRLMETLFEMSDEVPVASLRGPTSSQLSGLREAVFESATQRLRAFRGSPERVRRNHALAAYVAGALALVLLFVGWSDGALACASSAVVLLIGGRLSAGRTVLGGRLRAELGGLRLQLGTGPHPPGFEAGLPFYLPYAMVLGVADATLESSLAAGARGPDWFETLPRTGDPVAAWFEAARFARVLGAALRTPGPGADAARTVARAGGRW